MLVSIPSLGADREDTWLLSDAATSQDADVTAVHSSVEVLTPSFLLLQL